MLMGHKSSLLFLQFIGQTERSKSYSEYYHITMMNFKSNQRRKYIIIQKSKTYVLVIEQFSKISCVPKSNIVFFATQRLTVAT